MANLNYAHAMTGVRVTRNEVLNARPWATVKLIGFIVGCLVVAGLLLLGGALLVGARITIQTPAAASIPLLAMVTAPAPPAPVSVAPPVATQIIQAPDPLAPTTPVPASDDEALEQAFKSKLLAEGEGL